MFSLFTKISIILKYNTLYNTFDIPYKLFLSTNNIILFNTNYNDLNRLFMYNKRK